MNEWIEVNVGKADLTTSANSVQENYYKAKKI